jgi:hypothetical protein
MFRSWAGAGGEVVVELVEEWMDFNGVMAALARTRTRSDPPGPPPDYWLYLHDTVQVRGLDDSGTSPGSAATVT